MFRTLLAFITAVVFAVPALAQTYPSKPIRLIVPFPPGGGTDFVARTVATELSKSTGWTIVVENKAGAAGTIGLLEASRAPNEGPRRRTHPDPARSAAQTRRRFARRGPATARRRRMPANRADCRDRRAASPHRCQTRRSQLLDGRQGRRYGMGHDVRVRQSCRTLEDRAMPRRLPLAAATLAAVLCHSWPAMWQPGQAGERTAGARSEAARMEGRRRGRVTFVHTRRGAAPRERAVCSSLGSRLERAVPTMRMMMVVL